MRCKNQKVKETVEAATDVAGNKTAEARFSAWVAEVRKLAEERSNDTKRYREAAEDLQHAPK